MFCSIKFHSTENRALYTRYSSANLAWINWTRTFAGTRVARTRFSSQMPVVRSVSSKAKETETRNHFREGRLNGICKRFLSARQNIFMCLYSQCCKLWNMFISKLCAYLLRFEVHTFRVHISAICTGMKECILFAFISLQFGQEWKNACASSAQPEGRRGSSQAGWCTFAQGCPVRYMAGERKRAALMQYCLDGN